MTKRTKVVFVDEPFFLKESVEQAVALPDFDVTVHWDNPIDADQVVARAAGAEIIVVDLMTTYTGEILQRLPQLRALVTQTVATDHIDMDYCESAGIEVVNFPGFNARAVAETVLLYTLALSRNLVHAYQSTLNGAWNTFHFPGTELKGKTLGVVGAGNVGRSIIEIAQGIDMEVLCHTKNPTDERARSLGLHSFVSLDELLANSDVVVLSIPFTLEVSNLISTAELARMKETAYLINVGRWQLVDKFALADAIYERKIAGAALDFIAPEPYNALTDDLRIREMLNSPNVLLLPHLGFNTHESLVRLGDRMIEELKRLA